MKITIEVLKQLSYGYYKIVDKDGRIKNLIKKEEDSGNWPFAMLAGDAYRSAAQLYDKHKDCDIISLEGSENPEYRGNSL